MPAQTAYSRDDLRFNAAFAIGFLLLLVCLKFREDATMISWS